MITLLHRGAVVRSDMMISNYPIQVLEMWYIVQNFDLGLHSVRVATLLIMTWGS